MNLLEQNHNLVRDESGMWRTSGTEPVSYPEGAHASCFELEDSSFWFQHRNRCIVATMNAFPPAAGATVLDIGGGNGVVAKAISDAGYDTALLEPGENGARNALRRGVKTVINASLLGAGFADGSIEAAGLFDVVEHIEDEGQFLSGLNELMAPDAMAYLTVPAYPWLWSERDVRAGHFRRHTTASITSSLKSAGFDVTFTSYFFRPLPPGIALFRALPYRLGIAGATAKPKRDPSLHQPGNGLLLAMLEKLLKPEPLNLCHRKPMRFGGSCIVVARKP